MKAPIKERVLSAAVIVPIAVIVVVLAVLQYQWSNQVSEATSLRLADSLQMSMINWHLDLFRDLSQICLTLQVDPEGNTYGDVEQFARSYGGWKAGAPYPDLVSNFYLVQRDETAHTSALRLNPSSERFEAETWPVQLNRLRADLERLSNPGSTHSRLRSSSPRFADGFYPGGILAGWLFDPGIPALVHPITREASASGGEREHASQEWVVIELSSAVIQTKILPDLAQRYFQGTDGLDYHVAVIAGTKPRKVIYSSDSGFGKEPIPDSDGNMDLFGRVPDGSAGSPVRVFRGSSDNKGPAAAVGVSWFPLVVETPQEEDWQLIVQHRRGGPLGAFVAELRHRDLTISFGVLALLVISMAMLVITSQRAQRLAKLQMNFVTAISHELRTPLTVITSAADNIAHGVVDSKQQLAQYASVIGGQANQLSALVEQILLFAATREGRQRYTLRLLGVNEIVDAALANTAGMIRTAQFTVEREIDPGLPKVMGDLPALTQCLQNLITNALKYGSEARWMSIRTGLGRHLASGREIQVSVSDRGMGIGSVDLPHIFDPFYRSSAVAAAQIHGTGLGLPLAKSIAEAMKGKLTVTSAPGRGSTFTLHLPCAEQPVAGTHAEVSTAATSS